MQNSYQKKNWVWIGGLAFMTLIAIATLSFREKDSFRSSPQQVNQQDNDTTPRKSKSGSSVDRNRSRSAEMKDDDIEDAIRDLQKQMAELQMQLSQRQYYDRNYERQMEDAKRESMDKLLDESMMRDKIRMENDMERAMRNYKMDRLRELDVLNDGPDWRKSQLEMEMAMRKAQVDMNRMNTIDMKRQMEMAQRELQRNSVQMNRQMELAQKQMALAKINMEKANTELKKLRAFTDDLKKDGLIENGKPYEIEIKNGDLFINGKKVDQKINDKYKNNPDYKNYFKKDGQFKLKSDGKNKNEWRDDDDVV